MTDKRSCFNRLTLDEKIKMVEQICIIYPRFRELVDKIDYCRTYSKISAEPLGMLIVEKTGMGKTTIRKKYAKRFPKKQTKKITIVQVLHVGVPAPANVLLWIIE